MVVEESTVSFARPKWWLQKAAKEKLQQCAQASSRRGRRSTPSQPAQSLLCSGLVGCSLCCARARHAEAVSSGRRQRRHVSRVPGRGAGRRGPVGGVWTRSRAARDCAVPCASRPSHGTLARARPCECVRSMWPALGEGEPSRGVTFGWEPVAHARSAVRPIGARVCDPESRTVGERPTVGTDRTVEYCNRNSNELKTRPTQTN